MNTIVMPLVLSLFAFDGSDPKADVPSVESVVSKISSQRLGLRSGTIHIVGKKYYRSQEAKKIGYTYDTSFDGSSLRGDFRNSKGQKEIRCFSKSDKRSIVYVHTEDLEGDTLRILDDMTGPESRDTVQTAQNQAFDPRLIGTWPASIPDLVYRDLDRDLAWLDPKRGDHKSVKVEKTRFNDHDCLSLTYISFNDHVCKYWVDPEKGYNIVRVEYKFTDKPESSDVRSRIVESSLERLGSSDLWFPAQVHLVQKTVDDEFYEDATIKVVSYNQPLGRDLFSLSTMSIPPGTVAGVSSGSYSGPMTWDGKSLKPPSLKVEDEASAAPPGSPKWKFFFMVNAFAFGILAATVLILGIRRRLRAAPASP
jgi:hypothetical protein